MPTHMRSRSRSRSYDGVAGRGPVALRTWTNLVRVLGSEAKNRGLKIPAPALARALSKFLGDRSVTEVSEADVRNNVEALLRDAQAEVRGIYQGPGSRWGRGRSPRSSRSRSRASPLLRRVSSEEADGYFGRYGRYDRYVDLY